MPSMRKQGDLNVVEDISEYSSRRFLEIDERLSEMQKEQQKLQKDVDELRKAVDELKDVAYGEFQ